MNYMNEREITEGTETEKLPRLVVTDRGGLSGSPNSVVIFVSSGSTGLTR